MFVQECCLFNNGHDQLTLRNWRGGWWAWRTSHWVEVENRAVRSLLYQFTEHAIFVGGRTKVLVAKPAQNRRLIGSAGCYRDSLG